jgi:hypothetical protein
MIEFTKITNVKFEDIEHNDYPDYCDVFISYAEYEGKALTVDQLEILNENNDLIHEKLMEYLY